MRRMPKTDNNFGLRIVKAEGVRMAWGQYVLYMGVPRRTLPVGARPNRKQLCKSVRERFEPIDAIVVEEVDFLDARHLNAGMTAHRVESGCARLLDAGYKEVDFQVGVRLDLFRSQHFERDDQLPLHHCR